MKTYREALKELPSPHREAAIKNTAAFMLEHQPSLPAIYDVIAGAFVWDESPEGHRFWQEVAAALKANKPLPAYVSPPDSNE